MIRHPKAEQKHRKPAATKGWGKNVYLAPVSWWSSKVPGQATSPGELVPCSFLGRLLSVERGRPSPLCRHPLCDQGLERERER